MVKVYQVWKGSNRFACWGLFIFGPDVRSLLLSITLILSASGLFCAFVAWDLIGKLPKAYFILPCTVVFVIWDISVLMWTASRDPGIIPRKAFPPEPELGSEDAASLEEGAQRRLPRTKDVTVNGHIVKTKYCDTCYLYRPPRCSHCSICNNCVERFDHHCPWVGQCIGKRNYRFFYIFILSTTLLCIYVFSLSAVHISVLMGGNYSGGRKRTVWSAMGKAPVSIVLMAFTFIVVWFVGGLTAFHTYLLSTNQTTYENFRYRYEKKVNPFNLGCLGNVFETMFSSIPKSKNQFRDDVTAHAPPVVPINSSFRTALGMGMGMGIASAPRFPSRTASRNSSRTSSGGRSPSTSRDYRYIEQQRFMEEVEIESEGGGTGTGTGNESEEIYSLGSGGVVSKQLSYNYTKEWVHGKLKKGRSPSKLLPQHSVGGSLKSSDDSHRTSLRSIPRLSEMKEGVLTRDGDHVFIHLSNPLAHGYFYDNEEEDENLEEVTRLEVAVKANRKNFLVPAA